MTAISMLLLLGAVVSASPGPTASATVAPVPTIAPTIAPATAAATATATAAASPVPAASVAATLAPDSYGYRFVPHQPANPRPGAPQIFAIYLNAEHLKSRGPILIRVETSAGVVKMTSKSNGRGGTIPLVAPGVFAAEGKLPAIPFIASGISTDLVFTATTADGQTVTVRVPVELG